jgi:hypothetical protein
MNVIVKKYGSETSAYGDIKARRSQDHGEVNARIEIGRDGEVTKLRLRTEKLQEVSTDPDAQKRSHNRTMGLFDETLELDFGQLKQVSQIFLDIVRDIEEYRKLTDEEAKNNAK